MQFPTGGGQVLKTSHQTDSQDFLRRLSFETAGILFVFQGFQNEKLRKRAAVPAVNVFLEVARESASVYTLNRCDSGTDSRVWMEEEHFVFVLFYALSLYSGHILFGG